jgi:cytochrome c-type biogenesis protein CcmH
MTMSTSVKTFLFLLCVLFSSANAIAAIEAHEFDNELQRQRYQSFIEEMRCPKCQNQNLAGSDSPISADLRRELYEMIKLGKSDKEIVDFMVTRYGDFILYRPRITPATYVLWGAPASLLLIGGIVLIQMLRRRRSLALTQTGQELNAEEQMRLNKLLELAQHKPFNEKNNSTVGEESRS